MLTNRRRHHPPVAAADHRRGSAGLQAIATARRLGAMVEAYDVRSATREQVKSLGAKFVDTGVSAEGSGGYARELTAAEKPGSRKCSTRASPWRMPWSRPHRSPGARAKIISRAAVERMRAGSVVVDIRRRTGRQLRAHQGRRGVEHQGVKVVGR